MSDHRILIVDDEASLRKLLSVVLGKEGYQTVCAEDGEEAVRLFRQGSVDLVLMDIRMPRLDGLTAFKMLKDFRDDIPVILMTAYAGVETAVEALKQGAFDYIVKPFDLGELKLLTKKALEWKQVQPEIFSHDGLNLKSDNNRYERILTNSPNMMELCRNIAKVSQTNATVLIMGESGTGKELVAKAVHYHSKRATGPFIKINCGALPENLLESTLFGHEKGAFTGAQASQTGLFERAHNGTLLLDEVGEMSPNLQVKFLRVLQEKEFEPIGSSKTIKTDFRLIAATNRDLQEMVDQGEFREDLFYRLNVMSLCPPPLRERPDDIMLLARHFAQRFCTENNKSTLDFSGGAIDILTSYAWPGNIRELSNAVERAVIISAGSFICPEDLPGKIAQTKKEAGIALSGLLDDKNGGHNLRESMKSFERELIENALKQHNGHRELTAKALGVSKRTLLYKLQEYQIEAN